VLISVSEWRYLSLVSVSEWKSLSSDKWEMPAYFNSHSRINTNAQKTNSMLGHNKPAFVFWGHCDQ
jgi:hypothetical protein